MRKVELPEAVLDLLTEVAPGALLRIARGDGADEVADEVNIYTVLRWEDVPPVREALKNVRDHLIGGAPLDLHKVDQALEYVRVRKEEILTEEYPALLRAVAREVEFLWWFAEAFESRPISEKDVEAAIATLDRSVEDYLKDSPPVDVELVLAVKNSIAEVLWAAQPNTSLFHLEEALREGRWALKEFWGVSS